MRRHIATKMQISDEDLRIQLPHGNGKSGFTGRVGWAGTYLCKAGLIVYPKRGMYQITKEGKKLLAQHLPTIDNAALSQYPGFTAFVRPANTSKSATSQENTDGIDSGNETPEDKIEVAFANINASLEEELLTAIMEQDFNFFERLVVQLMQQMGYGDKLEHSATVTGQTGDEGIDGVIREDKFDFNSIYIGGKRWKRDASVGRPEMQTLVGALEGQGAQKGLFISTAKFTKAAQEYAQKDLSHKIILIDGTTLAKLMIEHTLGVSVRATFYIKNLDSDFFNEN